MQVWLRLLIVWFIALALPVQGIAGVTMAHCGQSHERMGAARATTAEPLHHQHAAGEAGVAHHHDTAVAAPADRAGDATASPADAPSDPLTQPGQYKCSSCASCCAGAALPGQTLRLPEPAPAPTVFAEALVTVDAFASDGPDRPPRSFLA